MGSDESRGEALKHELASLRRSRHWPDALEVALELTEVEPENGDNWFWLARAREKLLDLPGALAAYEESTRRVFALADVLLVCGSPDAARR